MIWAQLMIRRLWKSRADYIPGAGHAETPPPRNAGLWRIHPSDRKLLEALTRVCGAIWLLIQPNFILG
ncbi:hypothetical protein [Dongia mobilis]|jgi:hypothetical protein|uniref:hypothetical protein n=1 Tax=Dongia sp. TaxID=1977262 RepID=UPI0026EE0281